MSLPKTSRRSANAISLAIFLIGIGIMLYLNSWWPTIMLVIGASTAIRQFLRGRIYDMWITIFVFGGIYVFYFSPVDWASLMPVLFVVGGIYLLFREYFLYRQRVGKEAVENAREEIDDDRHSF